MVFLNALGGVFTLLIVVALGFILSRLGWFSQSTRNLLPRLVTNVALPPFLLYTIYMHVSQGKLMHMLYGALLPLLTMIIMFGAAFATARIVGVDKRHFGLFCACVANPNTIFIGIPVGVALFGQEAVPYVLLYYFASTCFFWTVGNYFISRDARAPDSRACVPETGLRHALGRIISAPMLGFLSGLLLVILDLHPPRFLLEAARITGEMTTPLALIFIGLTLAEMNLRKFRIGKDMALALVGRLVANPLLVCLLLPFFDLPELMGRVFIMQSSLPVLMQAAILSAYYDTDPEFGSLMVSFSTVLSAITIPVCMCLI